MYSITEEGILLKKIEEMPLDKNEKILNKLKEKADKIDVNIENLEKSELKYKKTKAGNLDLI